MATGNIRGNIREGNIRGQHKVSGPFDLKGSPTPYLLHSRKHPKLADRCCQLNSLAFYSPETSLSRGRGISNRKLISLFSSARPVPASVSLGHRRSGAWRFILYA